MLQRSRSLYIFLVFAIWLAILLPWNGFTDPDAFYHAKLSFLVWTHGPIHAFPWLDLTQLGALPADLHFLFHLIVAPFVGVFGMFIGLRIATVLLGAICVTTIEWAMRRLKISWPFVWVGLLLTTQPFLFRLLLAKASPLALTWFVLGLVFAWLRRPWAVLVIVTLFALSHAGWMYLVGSIILLMLGDAVYRHVVEDSKTVIRDSLWRESLAGIVGAFVGLLVHPNFPQNILLSWTQVVTIGLGTSFQHVQLGTEWLPAKPGALLASFAPWVIVLIAGLFGIFFAPKKPLDTKLARLTIALSPILAVLLALSLKSQRNVEYLAPIVALFCGALWSLVDPHKLVEIVLKDVGALGTWARRFIPGFVIFCFTFLLVREVYGLWTTMRSRLFPDDYFHTTMQEISKRAAPQDRVFHTSWDEFPLLFAADDRLRYISGLDPTFLYVASSTLSDQVRDVTITASSTTREQAWKLIHDETKSRFVFIEKERHKPFLNLIESDSRYIKIFDTTSSAAFEVSP